jgi:D-Tyr-tRNAtyr deacylase
MRAILQRATKGGVTIERRVKGEIGHGLVILLGGGVIVCSDSIAERLCSCDAPAR